MFDYSDCRGRLCFYTCVHRLSARRWYPPVDAFSPLFQYPQFRPSMAELTSQLGSQTGSRGLNGAWQWAWQWAWQRSPAVPEPAVDVSGGTDVTARQPDW